MSRRYHPQLILTALAASLIACGGESGPNGGGDGFMRATINGESWESDGVFVDQGVLAQSPGVFVLSGGEVSGSEARSVTLTLAAIPGPGTYPLGVGGTVRGGIGIVADAGAGWVTPLSGDAGTITITSLSATRIKGTFSFAAAASTGGATGTRTVTQGEFDLPVKASGGSLPVLPANAGGRVAGSVGGSDWTAATVVMVLTQTGVLSLAASNTSFTVSATVSDMAGPGVYPLSNTAPATFLAVSGPPESPMAPCCWTALSGQTGSITVETMTADRITGTFSGTLQPDDGTSAAGPIVVELEFDLGIP